MSDTKKLHDMVKAALPELETVIGWGAGFDPLRATPVFVKTAEDVEKLMVNPFCVQNLSNFLVKAPATPPPEGKKIGIFAKACDSKSLVALIQEKFIERGQIHVFGVPCRGTVDWRRVMKNLPARIVKSAKVEGEKLIVETNGGTSELKLEDVLLRKCLRCARSTPVISDTTVGEPVEPRATTDAVYREVEALDAKPLEERLAFWQKELGKCIRCYACRNACSLCVCQDRCIAETREPRWLSQYMGLSDKFLFHFIHAIHLAGRCTECGECERVCPMEIPVTLMKEKLNKIMKELMDYEAGIDPEAVPPLLTFNPSETGI
ncbi:MAG: 4Fe-4S dicluster domain-containing protein [Acidobacteriota bacterium]